MEIWRGDSDVFPSLQKEKQRPTSGATAKILQVRITNCSLFPYTGSISSLGCVMHPRFSSFHSGRITSTSRHPRLETEPTFSPKIWRYTVFLEKNELFLNKGEVFFPQDVAKALKVAKVPKCISRGFVVTGDSSATLLTGKCICEINIFCDFQIVRSRIEIAIIPCIVFGPYCVPSNRVIKS